MRLFWLLVAIPIIEIALFIQIGGLIGVWATLALVILAGMLGVAVIRSQSAATLAQVQRSMAEMRDPSRFMAHGMLTIVAGFLLILPGFFTDAIGLLLLIRPLRDALMRKMSQRVQMTRSQMGRTAREAHRPPYADGVIDGDYVVEDEPTVRQPAPPDVTDDLPRPDHPRPTPPRGGSGWTRG